MIRGCESSGAFGQSSSTPSLRARIRGPPGLAAGEDREVERPSRISFAVALTRLCGLLPPIVVSASSRGDSAELLGDHRRRVAVAPAEQADDPDRVRRRHGRRGRRRSPRAGSPRTSAPRIERVVEAGGPVEELAGADEHRCAPVQGCDRRVTRRGYGTHPAGRESARTLPPSRPRRQSPTCGSRSAPITPAFELKRAPRRVPARRRVTRSTTTGRTAPRPSTTRRSAPPSAVPCATAAPRSGIVLGGSGQGEQLAANKVHGVRAALCNDLYTARMARAHNDANVLSIGARIVGVGLAEEIVATFLSTDFEGGRHQRRVEQITEIETTEAELARRDRSTERMPFPSDTTPDTELFDLIDQEVRAPGHRHPADRERELHLTGGDARGRQRRSPTSTARAIRASATTAATRSSTTSSRWRSSERRRCSAPSTPTCSRTAAPTRTCARTRRCSSPATRSSGSASTTAATSRTARRSTRAASSTTSSPTR